MALPHGVERIVDTLETKPDGSVEWHRWVTFKASLEFIVFDVEIPDQRQPPSTAEPSTTPSSPQ